MSDAVVQIPKRAVSDGTDLRRPVRDLLEDLNLLGSKEETREAGAFAAIFTGPAQSVALIEAGATAAAKWWATGLGVAVAGAWASVVAWWGDQGSDVKIAVLAGAAFVTGALVIAIGHLLASDVRGRAAASVATIEARAQLATEMIRAAEAMNGVATSPREVETIPLPLGLAAQNLLEGGSEEAGWLAIALERRSGEEDRYILVKGHRQETVQVSKVRIVV